MEKYEGFDFVRLVTVDIHGRSRGKLIPGWKVKDFLERGTEGGPGIQVFGPRQEVECCLVEPPNSIWRAEETTIRKIPWIKEPYCVGEIICESYVKEDGVKEAAFNCRHLLRNQVQGLAQHKLMFKSAFELELMVYDRDTAEPKYPGATGKWYYDSTEMLYQLQPFLCRVTDMLYQMGVKVDKLETEFAPGQVELTFEPQLDMKTADDMFHVRECLREISRDFNCHVTFMARPNFTPHCFNGCHLNFSLCSVDEPHQNVLYDADKRGLTETGRYFIAGIIAHMDAIMSFACPTVNCYRRIRQFCVRGGKDWGYENRIMTLRCSKGTSKHGMRIEFRLVSPMANPYLVMAAVIAAGRDGIEKKLEPPEAGLREEYVVASLEQALDALEKDDVIVNSLGKEFVKEWTFEKREAEVKRMGHHQMNQNDVEELEREKMSYFDL